MNATDHTTNERLRPATLVRAAVGGVLMGLANLVPGISGGTMLVASGVYTRFIDAISDLTRLRFRKDAIAVLAVVVAGAAVSIVLGAGVIKAGLESFRWGMYSLFIGLTLGGLPIMLGMTRPMTRAAWGGLVAGVVVMVGLVGLQSLNPDGGGDQANVVLFAIGGIAGASAMILPGVSGAYLLLLLGLYDPIITAIKDFVSAAKDADIAAATEQLGVLIPVGIGVVVGAVGVGNLLRFVLHRYEKATLGFLVGLLAAAPIGLYPFQAGVEPEVGDTIKGELVTEENLAEFLEDPKDWAERPFTPSALQIGGSLGLILAGFVATAALAKLGGAKGDQPDAEPTPEASGDG
ncbi:MAG: hypothetical protein CMJ31_05740 [Phycisphaerae bacterium]|nr:hypothetical protein [Phycisphaerae bacterium]